MKGSEKGKRRRKKAGTKKSISPGEKRDKREARPEFEARLFGPDSGKPRPVKSPEEVAEEQAKLCEEQAGSFARRGDHDNEKAGLDRAELWRWLPNLSPAKRGALPREAVINATCLSAEYLDALTEKMTALYAMGEVAALMQATCRGLARLFDLTETLCTSSDASTLLATITGAVERFERLANEKPELFRPVTRGRMAIPAMVSQNKEKMEAAQALAKNLHTGEAYHLAILPTGNKGRHWQFKDPANALAARLVEEIEFTRVWSGWYRENAWWEDAVKLEPFSEHTWRSWAKFAWRILDNGNHPMLHDPRTKICNVRTQRTEEDFSKSAKWNAPRKIRQSPSIAAEDIREALFGAFELIATGISQRTKRRRKASPDK